jgi:tRNA pseudouridine13 synthase
MPRESDGPERAIGLEVFYTDGDGTGGVLKRTIEDFVVKEVSSFPPRDDDGRYAIATVTSRNWETNRLVRVLARSLGVSRSKITFAGTKDKRGITTQLMSFEASVEEVRGISIKDIEITDVYASRKHIVIGDLVGNSFQVWVRDCRLRDSGLEAEIDSTVGQLGRIGGFPNFFGVQRFGSLRPITHIVGRYIVRGDFEGACLAYVGRPEEGESPQTKEARAYIDRTKDFAGAFPLFPKVLTFERMIIGYLARNPGDYAGAIGVLPPNLQMMFVHAYQSYIFNRVLSERIRRGLPLDRPLLGDIVLPTGRDGVPDHDKQVPVTSSNLDLVENQVRNGRAWLSGALFGSDSSLADGAPGEIERKILGEENLRESDFVVPRLPKCSSKGSRRELVARFDDFGRKVEGGNAFFSFRLGRGCYATSFLREITKQDQILADRAAHEPQADDTGED